MRKFLITILLIFISDLYSEKIITKSDFVILPNDTLTAIFHFKDDSLQKICNLPYSFHSILSISDDGFMCSAIPDSSLIFVSNWKNSTQDTVQLSENYNIKTMLLSGDTIFFGGTYEVYDSVSLGKNKHLRKCKKPFVGYVPLSKDNKNYNELEIPKKLEYRFDKSIDELLYYKGRLIAVDNRILPKWLIEYKIDKNNKFEPKRCKRLKTHGTWERVQQASLGSRSIAILSVTGSRGGPGQHISILNKGTLNEISFFKTMPIPNWSRESIWPGQFDWEDIEFRNDVLFIAAGGDGLGILNISRTFFLPVSNFINKRKLHFFNSAIFENLPVRKVIALNKSNKLLIVLQDGDKYKTVVTSKNEIKKTSEKKDFFTIDKRNTKYWRNTYLTNSYPKGVEYFGKINFTLASYMFFYTLEKYPGYLLNDRVLLYLSNCYKFLGYDSCAYNILENGMHYNYKAQSKYTESAKNVSPYLALRHISNQKEETALESVMRLENEYLKTIFTNFIKKQDLIQAITQMKIPVLSLKKINKSNKSGMFWYHKYDSKERILNRIDQITQNEKLKNSIYFVVHTIESKKWNRKGQSNKIKNPEINTFVDVLYLLLAKGVYHWELKDKQKALTYFGYVFNIFPWISTIEKHDKYSNFPKIQYDYIMEIINKTLEVDEYPVDEEKLLINESKKFEEMNNIILPNINERNLWVEYLRLFEMFFNKSKDDVKTYIPLFY